MHLCQFCKIKSACFLSHFAGREDGWVSDGGGQIHSEGGGISKKDVTAIPRGGGWEGVRQRQNKKRRQVGTRPEGSKTTKRASGGETSAKQMTKNRNMAQSVGKTLGDSAEAHQEHPEEAHREFVLFANGSYMSRS